MGGSKSTQAAQQGRISEWRIMPWGEGNILKDKLSKFQVSSKAAKFVRILVIGQVGAGKSSFINSVNNVFQNRITACAPVDNTFGTSCTKDYVTYYIDGKDGKQLPFVITDIMGLEAADEHGAHPKDISKALKGLIEEGYKLNPTSPLSIEECKNPTVQDQTYCLVNVVAADKASPMDQKVIDKLKLIRQEALNLKIPQVIILTKIENACPLVKESVRNVYKSKRIHEKMQECSTSIGVPMSHIFPIKNYHEEIDTKPDIDLLILKALDQILHVANDRLKISTSNKFEEGPTKA